MTEIRDFPVDMDAGRRARVLRPKIDLINKHLARAAAETAELDGEPLVRTALMECLSALEALSSLVQDLAREE